MASCLFPEIERAGTRSQRYGFHPPQFNALTEMQRTHSHALITRTVLPTRAFLTGVCLNLHLPALSSIAIKLENLGRSREV